MTPADTHTPEILVILMVLAGIVVASLKATRGMKGACASEYFLAGRNVGWMALGISAAVTVLWGVWIVGLGAPVHPNPTAWVFVAGAVVLGILLLGVVFAPLYRGSRASTLAAFLGERFGRGVSVAAGSAMLLITLLVRIPLTILIGSRLLSGLFGWEIMSSALLMIVIPGLFVIAGGYRAVVATQTAGGVAAAAGAIFLSVAGGSLSGAMPVGILPELDASQVLLLFSLVILGLWFTSIDQTANQRSLAAHSDGAMKKGSILAAILLIPGVAALALTLGAAPVEPGGMANNIVSGFIGAGIIAFGMASLSGLFMSSSTIFTLDLLLANGRSEDDAALVLVGRLANTVVVILAITAASSISLTSAGSLRWMAHALAMTLPPLVAITLLGLVWPRMHGRGALWALLAGWTAGIVHAGIAAEGIEPILNEVVIAFVSSSAVCVAVSLLSVRRQIHDSVTLPLTQNRLEARKP